MKTEKELNDGIMKLTMLIQDKYPELVKYITEMPMTTSVATTPEVTIKNLQDYYNSLDAVIKKYAPSHNNTTN